MESILVVDHRDADTAAKLIALQRRAYAVEAELIGFDQIPPLNETADELMASPLAVLAVVEQGEVVGLLGYTIADGVVDIDRIAVEPTHFRRGHARRLLGRLHQLHPESDVVLSTGAANVPAIALYERLGYQRVGERKVVEILVVVDFCRPSGAR